MNNFSISGMPRAGSHFLAETLNKSKTWNVKPEVPEDFGPKRAKLSNKQWAKQVNNRLQKDCYGECASQHLAIWEHINVNKKVCVYRHPYDFWLSTINRRNDYMDKKFDWMFNVHYKDYYRIINDIATNQPEIMIVKFEDMIKNKELVMDIAKFVGIPDLSYDDINLRKKVNSAESHKQKHNWTSLNCLTKKRFESLKLHDSFCKRFYGNSINMRHEEKIK